MLEIDTRSNNDEGAVVDSVVRASIGDKQIFEQEKREADNQKYARFVRFGDADFEIEDDFGDATWREVFHVCCMHTGREWAWIIAGLSTCIMLLYLFILGLELLGEGAKVMSGCRAGALFGDDTNPIAGVMVGILASFLLQTSSTTTAIVVSLVPDVIEVNQGIYMIMGANVGTTATSTIVAMGQMGDGDQLERAFSGATVHDLFNLMTVAIILPLEVVSGYLAHLTALMVSHATLRDNETWEGPLTKLVAPIAKKIIISNSDVIKAIALGTGSCDNNSGHYPTFCEDDIVSATTCTTVGLIKCDKDTNTCPFFFQNEATSQDDKLSGGAVFFVALMLLYICLFGLVSILQTMLLCISTRIIYKTTDMNGYLALVVGCGVTVLVQSSSITTSILTPLVGLGAIRLEQMYPLCLGANIGTTVTGLLAALVSNSTQSLQVALAHLSFNVTGILIFYPIPYMRTFPIGTARLLGKATRIWRGFPLVYILFVFLIIPTVFLGISYMFQESSIGLTVMGCFVVIVLFLAILYTIYFCYCNGGKERCIGCMQLRESRRVMIQDLPNDIAYLKKKISQLIAHTSLPNDDDDDVDVDESNRVHAVTTTINSEEADLSEREM